MATYSIKGMRIVEVEKYKMINGVYFWKEKGGAGERVYCDVMHGKKYALYQLIEQLEIAKEYAQIELEKTFKEKGKVS